MTQLVRKNKQTEIKEKFHRLFEQMEAQLNGLKQHPWHQSRNEALQYMDKMEFPGRRDEDWKYTSITPIISLDLQLPGKISEVRSLVEDASIPNLDAYQLVFVNGHFHSELSDIDDLPKGLTVQSIRESYEQAELKEIISERQEDILKAATNAFLPLNLAFNMDGLFILLAKNTVIEKPLHLVHISKKQQEPYMVNPAIITIAEQGSQIQLIESYRSDGSSGACFYNTVNSVFVNKNAAVDHYKLQNISRAAFQVNHTTVWQEQDSTYSAYAMDLGGRIVRNTLSALLRGENTTTHLFGSFMADGEQHIDNQTFMDHALPNCFSNELYKGVVTDSARGVFNGKVLVRKDAQKTNAFQQNNNLVLSEAAAMDAKPQLEIFADDVKCSHGATIGQLDEDAVFYLKSRGLSDKEARNLLQVGFIGEVLDNYKIAALKKYILKLIAEKFSR